MSYIFQPWRIAAWTHGRAVAVMGVLALMALLLADAPVIASARAMPDDHPVQVWAEWLTHFGRSDWLLFPLGVAGITGIGVLLLVRWRFGVRTGAGRDETMADAWPRPLRAIAAWWQRLTVIVVWAFASIAGTGIAVQVPKLLIGRARPREAAELAGANAASEGWLIEAGPLVMKPLAFDTYDFASFPSGHACVAGALTAVLCIVLPRGWWLWVPVGVAIAWTRCIIGVHYPSDVVVGFWLGAAGTVLLRQLLMQTRHRTDLCLWPVDRPALSAAWRWLRDRAGSGAAQSGSSLQ